MDNGVIVNGTIKDAVDTVTPRLAIRDANLRNVNLYNYCHIPALCGYYFIDSVDVLAADVFLFNLRLDVLKTFETEIKQATATITQRENANPYISNREYVSDTRPIFQKLEFSEDAPFMEYGDIILTTIKGNV